jgi:polyisoprenoid-binding protein YceI
MLVRTYRQGVAARVGHDLLIEAAEWDGNVTVPADSATQPAVSVRVDLGALKVIEGTSGVKPLSVGDKQQIQQTMHKLLQVERHQSATFTSTGVEVHDDNAIVEGDLTLVGRTRPLRLEVRQRARSKVPRAWCSPGGASSHTPASSAPSDSAMRSTSSSTSPFWELDSAPVS